MRSFDSDSAHLYHMSLPAGPGIICINVSSGTFMESLIKSKTLQEAPRDCRRLQEATSRSKRLQAAPIDSKRLQPASRGKLHRSLEASFITRVISAGVAI